jgi:hypothetical protein
LINAIMFPLHHPRSYSIVCINIIVMIALLLLLLSLSTGPLLLLLLAVGVDPVRREVSTLSLPVQLTD